MILACTGAGVDRPPDSEIITSEFPDDKLRYMQPYPTLACAVCALEQYGIVHNVIWEDSLKRKGQSTPFGDHNRSPLRRQPRAVDPLDYCF